MKEKLNEELKALIVKYKTEIKGKDDQEYLNSLFYLMRVSDEEQIIEVAYEFLHEVHDQFCVIDGEIMKRRYYRYFRCHACRSWLGR